MGGALAGEEDEEADELDDDFVSTARPWLHSKSFHDVACEPTDFAEQLWAHVEVASYLRPDGGGGSLLLLLPSELPLSLFQSITESVAAGVATSVNSEAQVLGCHPDAAKAHERAPVPLLRVFADAEDLLVEGGSMSDAAEFL